MNTTCNIVILLFVFQAVSINSGMFRIKYPGPGIFSCFFPEKTMENFPGSPKYDASAAANWIARSIPPRAQVSGMDWASYIVLRRRGGCKQERQQHRPHSEYDPEGGGVAGGSKNQTDPGEG